MAVNKVVYNGETLIDLTEDNVTPETLAKGVTAHDKSGEVIIGTMEGGGGSSEDLESVLTEQEELISTLKETLKSKASEELNKGMCTVNIVPPSNSNYYINRETVDSNGNIVYNLQRSYTSATISVTARCDSIMWIQASTIKSAEVTDGEVLKINSGTGIIYKTPSLNNSIVQITLGG